VNPFIMRWFGVYTVFLLAGTLLSWWAWGGDTTGFGVLLAQAIFIVIFIGGSELNRSLRRWLTGSWGEKWHDD
jgi:hypothetical protein